MLVTPAERTALKAYSVVVGMLEQESFHSPCVCTSGFPCNAAVCREGGDRKGNESEGGDWHPPTWKSLPSGLKTVSKNEGKERRNPG